MPNIRTLQRSFAGGEVAPEFFGHGDDAKYQTGLASCRNFVVLPHGPIRKRNGFAFVGSAKNGDEARIRLIPFVFSASETCVVEMGDGYFRFFRNGAAITSGGIPYEIAHEYTSDELMAVTYVQSADIITLCHPAHPVMELKRYGWTDWRLETVSFVPAISIDVENQALTAVATNPSTYSYTYRYKVTAVDGNGNESLPSDACSVSGNVYATGGYNTLTLAQAVPSADRYLVYKDQGGVFGYIGQMDSSLKFVDDNITPDTGKVPPDYYDTLGRASGQYPSAVGYFQQRRAFAGTSLVPQGVWLTKSGTEASLEYTTPSADDNAIYFKVAGRRIDPIKHLVPLSDLVLLTGSGELRVTGANGDVLTPTVNVQPQSYIGAGNAQPVLIGNGALYSTSVGGHIRELAYNWQANGYISGDLSLRAPHLFEDYEILELAYQRAPVPCMWAVSSSGDLLGLTYVPEQQVSAWHHHNIDGFSIESACVIPEDGMDVLYVSARDSDTNKRRIMRCGSEATPWDCCVTVSDPAGGDVRVTNALAGRSVSILCADGSVVGGEVESSGKVTLSSPVPEGDLKIGLPRKAVVTTLPVQSAEVPAGGAARSKSINRVWLRVLNAKQIKVGQSGGLLASYTRSGNSNAWEQSILLATGWTEGGQLDIQHDGPGECSILSMSLEVALGG